MEKRMSVLEGNYLPDAIGDSYDLIFASSTLNFHKRNFDVLFRKIYDSLNPDGLFMAHQDGITDERTKPASLSRIFLHPN
jgi:hypothetical protein